MAVQIKSGSEADKDETGKEYSDKQVKAAIAESPVKRRYGGCHAVRKYSAREKEGPEKKKGRTEALAGGASTT